MTVQEIQTMSRDEALRFARELIYRDWGIDVDGYEETELKLLVENLNYYLAIR